MLLVGIDLGTTNTCLAWGEQEGKVHLFEVPQLLARGRGKASLLPSVLFAPLAAESVPEVHCAPPWVTGELARTRGAEVPGRVVVSAKSWLSHSQADPTSPCLPWQAGDDVPRISPVEASARYLIHLKRAWNDTHDTKLEKADIALTVPASFDDRARVLTLEAAHEAGLPVKLVEEPQAAFYDYMRFTRDESLRALANRHDGEARVLVVDVGGGTTDLSLIAVRRARDGVAFERIATGDHLLLGGDNMDLALAEHLRPGFRREPMTPRRFGQLVLACRRAKEILLAANAPRDAAVTLVGFGAKLVGSQESTRLTRSEVERILLDGFAPPCALANPPNVGRGGLVSLGLPYAKDVAITRHIARFLLRHGGGEAPHAILFNGGVFRSPAMRRRVIQAVSAWSDEPIEVLKERDPDLAVAKGAVAFLRARKGVGHRITAGTSRSYYVAVKGRAGEKKKQGVCILPYGAREGRTSTAKDRSFQLVTGERARFELWRATTRTDHKVGDVTTLDEENYARLPPIVAEVAGKSKLVDVRLSAGLSYVGTVEVSCTEVEPPNKKHAFAFQMRDAGDTPDEPTSPTEPPPSVSHVPKWATVVAGGKSPRLGEGVKLVERAFRSRSSSEPRELMRDLERTLGPRLQWTLTDVRALFDAVADLRGGRRFTPEHERMFWQLSGFTMRPGFGHPEDAARITSLWPTFDAALAFPERTHGWQAFLIAWRRMAAGLDVAKQLEVSTTLLPVLCPHLPSSRKGRHPIQATEELRECLTYLERTSVADRIAVGERTLNAMVMNPSLRLVDDLGRLGARVAMYAPEGERLPARVVAPWVERLLTLDFRNRPKLIEVSVRMSRVTDDPKATLPEPLRARVAKKILEAGATDVDVRAVTEWVAMTEAERALALGDAVPVGLVLRKQT